jgi:inner membrane protein
LFSLINEEIGARNKGPHPPLKGKFAATLALLVVFAYWGLCDYQHRRALGALAAREYQGSSSLRVSAYPYITNPFRWHGVVETSNFFATMDVDSLTPEVDSAAQMRIHYKPEETPITLAAKKTYLGRVYLSWAAYPLVETEELVHDPFDNGHAAYAVHFMDLRYDYPGSTRGTLSAVVFLNRDLQRVEERFGAGSSSRSTK